MFYINIVYFEMLGLRGFFLILQCNKSMRTRTSALHLGLTLELFLESVRVEQQDSAIKNVPLLADCI